MGEKREALQFSETCLACLRGHDEVWEIKLDSPKPLVCLSGSKPNQSGVSNRHQSAAASVCGNTCLVTADFIPIGLVMSNWSIGHVEINQNSSFVKKEEPQLRQKCGASAQLGITSLPTQQLCKVTVVCGCNTPSSFEVIHFSKQINLSSAFVSVRVSLNGSQVGTGKSLSALVPHTV